ncbi:hypothetical protein FACS1894202_07060 [Clostridia bacterium]|nr:hypothetical protein FACS1894202_07060 [Clostridia bacterium]
MGEFGNIKDTVQLGTVCEIARGGSPRPISDFITDDDDGINWIKIGDADGSRYITKTEQKIKPEGMSKSRFVVSGDLILSNSMSFGHPYILKIDGCIHDGWLVLHFGEENFNAIFLQTYLGLPSTYDLFSKMASGGVVNNLNSEVVRKLPVIVPPLDLQNRFAEFAEAADKSKFVAWEATKAAAETAIMVTNALIGRDIRTNTRQEVRQYV